MAVLLLAAMLLLIRVGAVAIGSLLARTAVATVAVVAATALSWVVVGASGRGGLLEDRVNPRPRELELMSIR